MSALEPGVYRREDDGTLAAVHLYLDDGYELCEVHELFELGVPCEDGAALALTRAELRTLRISAHAHSFDHGEAFIAMCQDIASQELAPDVERIVLVSIG